MTINLVYYADINSYTVNKESPVITFDVYNIASHTNQFNLWSVDTHPRLKWILAKSASSPNLGNWIVWV